MCQDSGEGRSACPVFERNLQLELFSMATRRSLSIQLMAAFIVLGISSAGTSYADPQGWSNQDTAADGWESAESYSFLNLEQKYRVRDFVVSEVDLIDSLSVILEGTTQRSLLLILETPCLEGRKSSEIIVNMPDGEIATGHGGILIYERGDDLRCSIRYIFDLPEGDRRGKIARKVRSHHRKLGRASRR
jgi:hypothetical protein